MQALEKAISIEEVRREILRMGKGKSPGPDKLGAEFYQTFIDLILTDLHGVLVDSHRRGVLPTTMMEGELTLLFKKGDPREVRNYRPITLLNTDYKVLEKVLASRLKYVLDSIISNAQLGFVPKRVISEASHLSKLVQAYLDETDEEGLLLALDWEKAFDRAS